MMTFEFTAEPDFDFLTSFSEQFGIRPADNKLLIPDALGEGSIRKIDFSDDFKLLIHHCTFREAFVLRRKAPTEMSDFVTVVFHSSALPNNRLSNRETSFECQKVNNSCIEVSSNDLNSEIHFPAGLEIHFSTVEIKASLLAEMLGQVNANRVIETVTKGSNTFLYHFMMTPDFEKILRHLSEDNEPGPLGLFFYKLKIQELFYLLFTKMILRENKPQSNINNSDITRLMLVRSLILADLSVPPQLSALARMAHMSETKMKLLFRQVFGDSIYNYYQNARMEEAALRLKQNKLSVSEVGYQLGFSNLSHFSRLFQKHHGHTPKKFQSAG